MGRRQELDIFEEAWAAAEAGSRRLVLVGGEPGAGKTRLVAEVAAVLADHGVPVLAGASSAGAAFPYEPFVAIVETLLGSRELSSRLTPEDREEMRRLDPRPEPLDEHSPEWRAAADRRGLFDAVAHLVRAVAEDHPTAIVLDDLHWANAPTLAMLEHLVRECADCPLLVTATFRNTAPDRSEELRERLAELHRLEGVGRLDLGGLDTDAIAEYLSGQSGISRQAALAPAAILRDRTGGNPFFLRELWTDLERRGGLTALQSSARVPSSIGDTLERRLAGLRPGVHRTLDLAAVLGDNFDLPTLVTASESARAESMDAIDSAMAVGLIQPVEGRADSFSFVHSLTREAVLARMPSSRFTLLNAQVAETLEAQGDTLAHVPRLAHHYLAAQVLGHGDKANRYATRAARQAERSFAFEEAAAWFEKAASLPEESQDSRAAALFGAAANHLRSGDFARARAIYAELTTMPDPHVRLEAAIGYEDANWRPGLGDTRPADLLVSAIDEAAPDSGDPLHIRALGSLGRALAFAGEPRRARATGSRAIDLARGHGERDLLAHTLKTSLWHGLTPDMAEVQLERSTELSAIAKELGDFEILGAASYFRAMVAYLSGRPANLGEAVKDIRRSVDATAQSFFLYVAGCMAQGLAFIKGDFKEAKRWADSTVRLGETFGVDTTEGSHGVQMFMIHREMGDLDRFSTYITGDETFEGRWIPGLLALYHELGNERGMRRALAVLLARDLSSHTAEASWPMELAFMIEAACHLEDLAAADELMPFATAYSGTNLVAGQFVAVFGSADRFLARLTALRGDEEAARRHFRLAEEMDRRMGSTVHLAETLAHHAIFLSKVGEPDAARPLGDRARAMAKPTGQRRTLDLLDRLHPAHSPAGLSEREVEVLRLLALGLSNREIGDRLYISANTAANHVRRILMKTGAANRTQAAVYGAEHDVI